MPVCLGPSQQCMYQAAIKPGTLREDPGHKMALKQTAAEQPPNTFSGCNHVLLGRSFIF